METSVNRSMCRCCASEGAFKDVKSTYHWMGEEEIYADMLRDCFDINLSATEDCDDGGICEVCITQLRNAINFKKQVLHTEEQFKKLVQNKALFRTNIVKIEATGDDDSDENVSADDGFSGPEYDVPIKTEEEEQKPKKRAAASKVTTRSKKAKADSGETSTKQPTKKKKFIIIDVDPDAKQIQLKRKKEGIKVNANSNSQINLIRKTEVEKHRDNIRTILLNSNATPIGKYAGIGYACSYCSEEYETPAELKNHTIKEHEQSISNFMAEKAMHNFIVKLDITNLKCKICQIEIDTLEQIIEHLKSMHDMFYHSIKNHILPFKFDSDLAKCVVCGNDYSNFKVLLEHMNTHYKNYTCKVCNAGFVTKKILQTHSYRHQTGVFTCSHCSKEFNTHIKKREHEKAVHVLFNLRSKCGYCGEKFTDYAKKNSHEVKMHGAKPVVLQCQACEKTFDNQRALTVHTKTYHLMEKHIPK